MNKQTKKVPKTVMRKTEFAEFKKEHDVVHKQVTDSLAEMHDKLDKISNIKVNGRTGLEDSLRDIYNATISLRAKRSFEESFLKWKETSKILKLYDTKFGKYMFYFSVSYILLSVLHSLEIIQRSPVEILRNFFEILKSIL